jgi:hypothetical protein
MDTTLVTVTLLSMAMAAALSVIVWRMLRDERRRSEARVLALTAAAARPSAAAPASQPEPRPSHVAPRTPHPAPRTSHVASRTPDLDLAIRDMPAPAAAMFVERDVVSPWGHRFAVMCGLGLVGASVILFSLMATDRNAARRGSPAGSPAAAAQPVSSAATAAAGLELMSLRDGREPGSLRITGLVQNPRGAATLSRVTVTAYAFDDKGAFLASGRAALDVTTLAPGDESPFVVSVPVTETVARYRIGFRGEDGRVIAHIDKRQQAPVAALRPGSGQASW